MPQKAIVVTAPGKASLVSDRPLPALRDDYIRVKTISVALNPTDWKGIDQRGAIGGIVGCDYAGIVEEVGPAVSNSFCKGDRICGFAHGCNNLQLEDGGFAEHIVVKGAAASPIPDSLSYSEAATLGVGIATVALMYQSLGLALPSRPISSTEPEPILIYGGSTATGSLAIQFAKLSGYTVLTTCSPRNFDFVTRLGADVVFDYHDPNVANTIRELTKDNLRHVFDTISLKDTARFCDAALSTHGGEYVSLLLSGIERENVRDRCIVAYTTLGEYFTYGPIEVPAKPEDVSFAANFWKLAYGLLDEGKVRPHPQRIGKEGLQGVLEGLKLMKDEMVSGEKLVYNVADTP
ncbi:hypothetical protein EYZ11_006307 [Aspergillus tanneri]|uniref:Enoyl reductase (ER) domain-containing protein n=1 Tax=Aspergillus tanneri TaxID=1220188 RepID=A0A4S3JI84_9EURO|nr:uncharacterized protein ATNIH1004_004797 [Aspergillus tanneri]KAA8648910.1 hypothetical protein ATNIH1004_004797 [Aspergillus tanneri]THC94208.1 hypothetical protein EYZ11_006307 [Aspergillus tanneri]